MISRNLSEKTTGTPELKQIRILRTKINHLRERAEELRSKAFSLGSMDFYKDRVQTSPEAVLERQIAEYLDMVREADEKALELERLLSQIMYRMFELESTQHIDVLYKFYVQNKRIREIAVEMNYSYRQTKRLLARAREAYAKVGPTCPL